MSGRLKLVVSDFHQGKGYKKGFLNEWESFYQDDKFAEFLHYFSTDYYEDEEVELIINGDFYDFLQVDVDGRFPEAITEEISVRKLKACLNGHPKVVDALARFLEKPAKNVVILPGNHDIDFIFPRVRELFKQTVAGDRESDLIQFIVDGIPYTFDGIQICHGNRYEAVHQFDPKNLLITRGRPEPILNLPWGSYFFLKVVNRLKRHRPYLQRVYPFNLYLRHAMIFDPLFALKVIVLSVFYFIKTRFIKGRWRIRGLRKIPRAIKQLAVYPNFEKEAQKIFRHDTSLHTLIFGHSHLVKVRQFEGGRQYINTGTWINLISLDISDLGIDTRLPFVLIEYGDSGPQASLKEWRGYHDIMRDIVY
jgi:UDP-2,3-diacylglucosamine pyrophosphatase LpxH